MSIYFISANKCNIVISAQKYDIVISVSVILLALYASAMIDIAAPNRKLQQVYCILPYHQSSTLLEWPPNKT